MESDWSQGYVTEVLYTEHFFRELSPAWLNYVATINGCQPRPLDPGFTYMELGCGLGQSVTLLAGAHPQGRFFGVDFNPAHVDWARRYAASAGIGNVEFLERSFLDLGAQEVPECDFIVLHGVYAWVSTEVRAGIQRIIRERLKPGGLVYNSYNCLPGWAADSPLQKLILETSKHLSGDATQRTQAALKSVEELVGAKFGYFAVTPTAGKMAAKMSERNANYLAHEFLNEHWTPFYSSDVADEMSNAKLNFVGSATLAENHLELLGGDDLQAKVKAQPTQRLRQLFQDLAQNQRFRRDVFVRGHAQLNRAGIVRNMENQAFGALRDLKNVTNVAKVARGEVKFDEKAFPALKELLQQGTWSVGGPAQGDAGAQADASRRRAHHDADGRHRHRGAVRHVEPSGADAGESQADQDPARHQPRADEAHGRQPGAGQPGFDAGRQRAQHRPDLCRDPVPGIAALEGQGGTEGAVDGRGETPPHPLQQAGQGRKTAGRQRARRPVLRSVLGRRGAGAASPGGHRVGVGPSGGRIWAAVGIRADCARRR